MIFIDETMIHLILCYSTESNNSDVCAPERTEQFVIANNVQENENDTIQWLKSHCFSINSDDFIVSNNSGITIQSPFLFIISTRSEKFNKKV